MAQAPPPPQRNRTPWAARLWSRFRAWPIAVQIVLWLSLFWLLLPLLAWRSHINLALKWGSTALASLFVLVIAITAATPSPKTAVHTTQAATRAPAAVLAPTRTATRTSTALPTHTPTSKPTATPSPTPTPKPTATPSPTPTSTPSPPTPPAPAPAHTQAPPPPAPVQTAPAAAAGAAAAPAGATALCNDGTYDFSAHRRGSCSRHHGVAQYLVNLPP